VVRRRSRGLSRGAGADRRTAEGRTSFARATRARRFGFGAKLCIHPKQIAAVHAAFAPTDAEIAWARRVLAASAEGAAARVDGEMVDAPVVALARRILQRAQGA
jgi:citrate lyase subunit beta/citryl-CoA lyase